MHPWMMEMMLWIVTNQISLLFLKFLLGYSGIHGCVLLFSLTGHLTKVPFYLDKGAALYGGSWIF
jgi:hypothetical protein